MSVDVMIETMEQGLDPNGETIKHITAALKAGQAMRDSWEVLKQAEGFYSPKSCAAWDAATKEGV